MNTAPLNVAVIGSGIRTTAFCSFAARNPEKMRIAVLCDTITRKAEILRDHYKLNARIHSDFLESIHDPAIEAVIISTPDYLHVEPAVASLQAGNHVYLEKPLATTLRDCDQIIDAARNSGSKCYLGFNMRHSPVHEKIHALIHEEKRLGKVTTIEANEWYYGGKTYFRRWNRHREFGGGLWLTKACHDFDLITWIAGAIPHRVFALSSLSHYTPIEGAGPRCRDCRIKDTCPDYYDIHRPAQTEFDEIWRRLQLEMDRSGETAPDICLYNSRKDTFDNGTAVIEFENDVRAAYTVNVLAAKTTRQMRVIGTDGMAEADMETGKVLFTERHTEKVTEYDLTEKTSGSHGGADEQILGDFVKVCRGHAQPRSGLKDGRLAVQISLAATQSDDSGQPVRIS